MCTQGGSSCVSGSPPEGFNFADVIRMVNCERWATGSISVSLNRPWNYSSQILPNTVKGWTFNTAKAFSLFLQSSKYMMCVWYKRFLKVPSVVALPTTWSLTESALCAHQHAQMWGNSTETSSLEVLFFFFLQVLCPTEWICKNPSLILTFFSPFYCSSERWSHVGFTAPRLSITFSAFQKSQCGLNQVTAHYIGSIRQWLSMTKVQSLFWRCFHCFELFLLRGV